MVWSSDVDGEIATGPSAQVGADELSEGVHVLTATATDSAAGTGTDSATIEVFRVAPPPPPDEEDPEEAFVTALYLEVLGRLPDAGGLAFWSGRLDGGDSRASVADAVLRSSESIARQVMAIYADILGRSPDDGGLAFWQGVVGATGRSESVLVGLLASWEYLANAGGTSGGFVDALYEDLLGRTADAGGRQFWTSAMSRGTSRQQVAEAILRSSESAGRVVAGAYLDVLGRAPDPGGAAFFTAVYSNDQNRLALVTFLLQREEFLANALS